MQYRTAGGTRHRFCALDRWHAWRHYTFCARVARHTAQPAAADRQRGAIWCGRCRRQDCRRAWEGIARADLHMSALPARDQQSIETTRDTVARWLLHGGAQIRDGAHAGGVAGVVSGNGSAEYVYPEITGYYLQWLAWYAVSRGHSMQLVERAKAAQGWLRTWLRSEELPATRVHLRVSADDWRNGAVFFFDVAM